MPPGHVHFTIGAAILLILLIPIGLRDDRIYKHGALIVAIGGVWGYAPDFYRLTSIEALEKLHYSPWADLFALHYSMDRTGLGDGWWTIVSFSLFFASVAAFQLSAWFVARDREPTQRAVESD